MKKFLNTMAAVLGTAVISAMVLAGCSNAAVSLNSENASAASRSTEDCTVTITSDLNPGYGKAVYFTGTFYEAKKWNVAVRGEYSDGKWSCKVTSYSNSFEYKALVGNWDEGETVTAEFPGLTKIGKAHGLCGYQGQPGYTYYYDGADIKYGDAVYFFRDDNYWTCAYRGEFKDEYTEDYCPVIRNSWIFTKITSYYYNATAYVGSYDLGETVSPVFTTLTWESGENHVYTK